jgi:hypothetical protein
MTLRTQISVWERKKKKREELAAKRQEMIDAGIDPDQPQTMTLPQSGALVPLTGMRAVGGSLAAAMTLAKGSNIAVAAHANNNSNNNGGLGFGVAGVGIAGLTLSGVPTVAHAARVTATNAAMTTTSNVISSVTSSNPYQTPLRVGNMPPSPSARAGGGGKLHSAVGAFRRAPSTTGDAPLISSATPTPPQQQQNNGGSVSTPSSTRHRRPAHGSVVRNTMEQYATPASPLTLGSNSNTSEMIGRDQTLETPTPQHNRRRTAPANVSAFGRSVVNRDDSKASKDIGEDIPSDHHQSVGLFDLAIGTSTASTDAPQPHINDIRKKKPQQRIRHRAPLATKASQSTSVVVSADIAPLIQPGHMIPTEERIARVAPNMGRLRLPPRHTSSRQRSHQNNASVSDAPQLSLGSISSSSGDNSTSNNSNDDSSLQGLQPRAPSGTLFRGRQPLRSLGNGLVTASL